MAVDVGQLNGGCEWWLDLMGLWSCAVHREYCIVRGGLP